MRVNSREYREYLESPEWKRLRELAIERADGRCQLCNVTPPTFHVHHRTYERLGHERVEDLTALCPRCHRRYHRPGAAPDGRAERRREIDRDILVIVGSSGLIAWRDVQRQIQAPRAQAWARARKLIRRGELAWKNGKLCLGVQRDLA